MGRYHMTPIFGEAQESQVIANSDGGFTLFDSIRAIGSLQAVIFLLEPRWTNHSFRLPKLKRSSSSFCRKINRMITGRLIRTLNAASCVQG